MPGGGGGGVWEVAPKCFENSVCNRWKKKNLFQYLPKIQSRRVPSLPQGGRFKVVTLIFKEKFFKYMGVQDRPKVIPFSWADIFPWRSIAAAARRSVALDARAEKQTPILLGFGSAYLLAIFLLLAVWQRKVKVGFWEPGATCRNENSPRFHGFPANLTPEICVIGGAKYSTVLWLSRVGFWEPGAICRNENSQRFHGFQANLTPEICVDI